MKLIILGGPGAGKGTQAQIISEKYGIPTISTGNILRANIKDGTELGKTAQSYIEKGALVPDTLVINMVKDHLTNGNFENGYILDGFPRSIPQAEALDALGIKMDVVLNIEVADDVIIERMSGRRTCDKCGASFHIKYKPSSKGEDCDVCNNALSIRKDDIPEVVKSRLDTYHDQTEPLKEYYAKSGLLVTVYGQEEVADTTRLVLEALSKVKG